VMAAVQDRGQFHGGESSTINRHQTRLTILVEPWAARQNLSPRRVDSDDHRHQSPRRRQPVKLKCVIGSSCSQLVAACTPQPTFSERRVTRPMQRERMRNSKLDYRYD
jgi:hypothetical protein